jgi:hypothetical protein
VEEELLKIMPLAAFVSALLLLQNLSQAPDLSAKVAYETVAAPAARVVKELSEKTGIRLEVSASAGNPVLVLRLSEVPLKEAMDRIATVCSAQWQFDNGTHRLVANSAVHTREAIEERQARIAAARIAMKKVIDSTLHPPAPTKPPAKSGQAAQTEQPPPEEVAMIPGAFGFGGGAAERAIAKLLIQIGPDAFATLADDDRIVFSTAPTRMQRGFPGNVAPIFEELITEHNKQTANRPERTEPKTDEEQELENWMKAIFGRSLEENPINERPAKALLVAGSGMFGFGTTLELRLYGSNGKVLLRGQQMIALEDNPFAAMAVNAQNPKPQTPAISGDTAIELSNTTEELSRIFGGLMQGSTESLSKDLEERLTRPDLYDPLSFVPSESLIFSAKHKNLNLVADLPDGMVSFFGMMVGNQKKTVETFLTELRNNRDVKVEMTDGWLSVRPSKPEEARNKRADRLALAKLIAAARSKGSASLDDIAAYAQTSDPPMEATVSMPYLILFAANTVSNGMSGMVDWNMLRLYGSLSQGQRDSLLNGAGIPFGNLSPNQQAIVRKMGFGPNARLAVQDADKPEEPGGFLGMIKRFMPGMGLDWREEPTEIMPNGLPPNGTLSLKASDMIVGAPSGAGAITRMMGVLGADELAMLRYFTEDPKMAQMGGGMMPRIDGLKLGQRRSMKFIFTVAPKVTFDQTLNDDRIDKNAPVTPMDRLPADFLAQIEKKLNEYKKNPIPFPMGVGRANPPPK